MFMRMIENLEMVRTLFDMPQKTVYSFTSKMQLDGGVARSTNVGLV